MDAQLTCAYTTPKSDAEYVEFKQKREETLAPIVKELQEWKSKLSKDAKQVAVTALQLMLEWVQLDEDKSGTAATLTDITDEDLNKLVVSTVNRTRA
ncbi:MAG: hypothetical protein KGL39_13120 [Patescibacteria group bacterium]|nr:hypothetical protein [Patescibacteria group bacterium]